MSSRIWLVACCLKKSKFLPYLSDTRWKNISQSELILKAGYQTHRRPILIVLDESVKALHLTDGHAVHPCHYPQVLICTDTMDQGINAREDLNNAGQDGLENTQ
jgi:hypothetical protein